MIRLDAATRERHRALKAELRALEKPAKEAARLARREAARNREKAVSKAPAMNQRESRRHDALFLAWVRGLPCVACLIEGPAPVGDRPNPVEAAHQRLEIAEAGWKRVFGRKVHDRQCAPLCVWHHRLGPGCCDPAQRVFWDRLGVGDRIADLCRDLYAAFKGEACGSRLLYDFAKDIRDAR